MNENDRIADIMMASETQNHLRFTEALAVFVAAAQKLVNDHFAANYPVLSPPRIEVCTGGQRYVRIVKAETIGSGCSAFCFIERETGNVLKPDGFKRPAKGVRGNIYTPNLGITAYGATYAR